ncbi:MAG: virulence protein RhuM/Fic/DOC family protein [Candidatus Omnitrophica bacterium]|nr:virulence protein RhuM/Fic/DOC family protein [Candidatus Omnitrophota bacterium]
MKNINPEKIQDVVLFQSKGNKISLEVKLKDETVWLTQAQMSEVFLTERSVISKHIHNILKSNELMKGSVCAFFAHTASDGKIYNTQFYNLDMIISVGYRVNSKRGTQFRIWATSVLKQHLIQGYTINDKRLKEQTENLKNLQRAVQMLADLSERKALTSDEAKGLFEVIRDYSYGLDVLDDYDHGRIKIKSATAKESYQLTYNEGIQLIQQMRQKFGGSSLFGQEKDGSFKSALGAIYQTFSGKDLYPTIEEKAANLLYMVVKNHSFSDGNKRIAAALFVWFLDRNKILYKEDGAKRIADNALVAITLMIAESHPKEKDIIVALVVNLINKLN